MDEKFVKELSHHICQATVEAMKTYLFICFWIGFAIATAILCIIYLCVKG